MELMDMSCGLSDQISLRLPALLSGFLIAMVGQAGLRYASGPLRRMNEPEIGELQYPPATVSCKTGLAFKLRHSIVNTL